MDYLTEDYESLEQLLSYSDSQLEAEFGENIASLLNLYRVGSDESV